MKGKNEKKLVIKGDKKHKTKIYLIDKIKE